MKLSETAYNYDYRQFIKLQSFMQINLKRKILFIVLLATSNLSFADDTLQVNSFNSIKLLKSNNPWLGT